MSAILNSALLMSKILYHPALIDWSEEEKKHLEAKLVVADDVTLEAKLKELDELYQIT